MSLYYFNVFHENVIFYEEHFKVMIRLLSMTATHCKKKFEIFESQLLLL